MLTIICDTREQRPLDFSGEVRVIRRALSVGDYSLAGLEDQIVIERKSLSDLLGSITAGRGRFARELRQLRAFRFAAIVVESDWPSILMKAYPQAVHPNAVIGSLLSFAVKYGVQVVMAGDHDTAGMVVEKLLALYARMVERDYKALQEGAQAAPQAEPAAEATQDAA